jgi:hypothetical protein
LLVFASFTSFKSSNKALTVASTSSAAPRVFPVTPGERQSPEIAIGAGKAYKIIQPLELGQCFGIKCVRLFIINCATEGDKERIALGVDLPVGPLLEGSPQDAALVGRQFCVILLQMPQQPGGAFDIGEKQGDGSRR